MQNSSLLLMSQDSSEQEKELQRTLSQAFRYTIDEIAKTIHNHHDMTITGFLIAYNKKLKHVEILKIVLMDNKKITLEPPVWISNHKYNPLNYSCNTTKDRISIMVVPAQLSDIKKHIKEIIHTSKQ